jgi:predicted amidohydrolase
MSMRKLIPYLVFSIVLILPFRPGFGQEEKNLIQNPTFKVKEGETFPSRWMIWKPIWEPAACEILPVENGLQVRSHPILFAVGGITQEIMNIEGGQAYQLYAGCWTELTTRLSYSPILMRVTWLKDKRKLHPAGMLVHGGAAGRHPSDFRIQDILIAPEEANGAMISLEVKWPQGGTIIWKYVSMKKTETPKPRKVKIGTVFLRPRNSTPAKNLKLFCEQVDQAGKLGLDIICLGEVIRLVGTGATINDVAESIPGPASRQIGAAAKKNNIWVVVSLIEKLDNDVFNTGVLFNRQGEITGKYHKVHLPREEWKKGVKPGFGYSVFHTDFGTIAIEICYDWFFPETEGIFARRGAEIIFAPTWGNTLPDEDGCVNGETTFRVRARDNGVYMVPSVYDGNSMVIDPMGRILASSNGKSGVFWAEVDLNKRETMKWVGHWRSIGPRHRMRHTYEEY